MEVFIHYKHSTVTSTKNTTATSKIHNEIRERLDISRLLFYHGANLYAKKRNIFNVDWVMSTGSNVSAIKLLNSVKRIMLNGLVKLSFSVKQSIF